MGFADIIGPYTSKEKKCTILDIIFLVKINLAASWFEIVELWLTSVSVNSLTDISALKLEKYESLKAQALSSPSLGHFYDKLSSHCAW